MGSLTEEFKCWRERTTLEISGVSVAEWKAKGLSLGPECRASWRTTMAFLEPASCASMSLADYCAIHGATEDQAIAIGQESRRLFELMNKSGVPIGENESPSRDGWPEDAM